MCVLFLELILVKDEHFPFRKKLLLQKTQFLIFEKLLFKKKIGEFGWEGKKMDKMPAF